MPFWGLASSCGLFLSPRLNAVRQVQQLQAWPPHPSHSVLAPGQCSPTQVDAIESLQPESLLSCQLQFKQDVFDFPARDIFSAEPRFDAALGESVGLKADTMCTAGLHPGIWPSRCSGQSLHWSGAQPGVQAVILASVFHGSPQGRPFSAIAAHPQKGCDSKLETQS